MFFIDTFYFQLSNGMQSLTSVITEEQYKAVLSESS